MRPFSIYPNSFDGQTLGYWRFGERGGRLDGLVGPTLTNDSATPLDDGYRFAGAGQYLQGTVANQPARAALTLEMWVRAWATAVGSAGRLGAYREANAASMLFIDARRHSTPAQSYIYGAFYNGASYISAYWTDAAADAILAGAAPWHAAVTMANGSPVRLFVNGVLVSSSSPTNVEIDAAAGTYSLYLAQDRWATMPALSILDEVRLSAAARYAVDFKPARFQEGRRAAARGPGLEVLAGTVP